MSDTANPTDLAVQDAPETIAVTEIVQAHAVLVSNSCPKPTGW